MIDENDEALIRRIVGDIRSDADSSIPALDPFDSIPSTALRKLITHAAKFSSSSIENAIQLSTEGAVLERSHGSATSVGIHPIANALSAHNHPGNSPPSQEDLELMIDAKLSYLLVIANCGTEYHLSPTGVSVSDIRPHFHRLVEISTEIALKTRVNFAWRIGDDELYCRQVHAMFCELARRHFLCYARVRWMKTLPAMRKPDSPDSGD